MTEHRHETKRFIYWNGEYWKQDANGELTYKMPIVEIERRLNAVEALVRENKFLRANCSKSVLRRLNVQLGGEDETE